MRYIYFNELGMDMAEGDSLLTTTKATDGNKGGKAIKVESTPAIGNAMQNNGLQSLAGLTRATSQLTEQ